MSENMTLQSVQNKLKMFIGITTGLLCAFNTAWFFYRACFHYNVEYIMQFAALTFDDCHAAVIIFHNYIKYPSFRKGVEITKKHFWNLDDAEPEAREEISRDMKVVKFIMVTSLSLVLSCSVVYLPYGGIYSNDALFIAVDYLDYFKLPVILEYLVIFINVFKLFPQSYCMLSYLFTLCYFINQYRYQINRIILTIFFRKILMVKHILLNITRDLEISDERPEIVDNIKCQNVIKEKLNSCIKHHIMLISYADYVINYFYYTIIWQIVSGISLFTSLLYIFMFHNAANSPIAVGTNIMAAYFAAFLYTAYGQLFQDQTDILLQAAGTSNWHCFNSSNRKSLLIFMLNLRKQYRIVGAGIIALNFEMFIWFSNKIVGLLSVVSMMEE